HKSFLSCAGLFPMRLLCCCAATQDKRNCPKKCPHGPTSHPANSTDKGPRPARPLQSVWLFISDGAREYFKFATLRGSDTHEGEITHTLVTTIQWPSSSKR